MSRLIIFWPALLAAMSLFLFSCADDQSSKGNMTQNKRVLNVEVLKVFPEPLTREISVTGSILANEEVELRSESPGRLVKLAMEEGTLVRKGELLAKINDGELSATLESLILQDSLLSKEEFRKRKLLEIKAISKEEYDQVKTSLAMLRAEQEAIVARIEKTEIVAPFSGMLGLRNVSEGAIIDAGTVLATMQQIDPVKIEFSIPEKHRIHLKNGTEINFTVTGIDSVFSAQVYAVESRIDPMTRNVTVRARCSNEGRILFPGAFARINIILEQINDALLVPAEAVVQQLNEKRLFIIENGKAVSRVVTTGIRTENRTQITSGIAQSDSVAVTGLLQLRDGAAVKVLNANNPAKQ
jgi:membrane fusion protein (multidrug efflux system)